MATKTKERRLGSESPPREIQEKTKERRAWLAAKVEEINAQPNRRAKIVGVGSYQSVTTYETVQVEGRLRYRGHCQFCGHSQVAQPSGRADERLMVLHGYERPGDGMIVGRCPGMGLPPLNVDKTHTQSWYDAAVNHHFEAKRAENAAEKAAKAASDALWSGPGGESVEPNAYREFPKAPSRRYATPDELRAFEEAREQWAEKFPLAAAASETKRKYEAARQAVWQADAERRHFKALLEMKVYGTPLTEEIV